MPTLSICISSIKGPVKWGGVAALLAALLSLALPDRYRSVARILPVEAKPPGSGLGQLISTAAAFGVNLPGQEGAEGNYADILASRWMAESLLKERFRFQVRSWKFGAERAMDQTLSEYLDARNPDDAARKVQAVLAASRDTKSKILLISAETRSPELSQQIVRKAEALLEEFVHKKGRTRGGAQAAFAEARLAEARDELAQAQEAFRTFLNVNRNYATSSDPSIRITGAGLEAEWKLRTQMVMTLSMNREQALLEEKNDLPILNVMDPGNLPVEKSGPARSRLVLVAFFLAGLGVFAWENRSLIRNFTTDVDPDNV